MAGINDSSLFCVAALAGRRADSLDAETARFPLANVASVKTALTQVFVSHRLTHLVCAAACGADLVALEVAQELGVERSIILPFAPAAFRKLSVVDRPGDWGPLFDRIIAEATSQGRLQVLGCSLTDKTAFSKTTRAIIDQAIQLGGITPAFALVVWEGKSRGEGDATEEFAVLSHEAGLHKIEVLTL